MTSRYASAKNSIAECDICGFRYKLRELKRLVVKNIETDIKACPECWNPGQPQLMLGTFPINDPQAVRDPRPDFAGYPESRAYLQPATENGPIISTGFIGTVTVETTP